MQKLIYLIETTSTISFVTHSYYSTQEQISSDPNFTHRPPCHLGREVAKDMFHPEKEP